MAATKKKKRPAKRRMNKPRAAKRRSKKKRAANRPRGPAKKRPVGWMVQFRSRLQAERAQKSGFDNWTHLREIYRVEQNAREHAARIRESEAGMNTRVVPIFEGR